MDADILILLIILSEIFYQYSIIIHLVYRNERILREKPPR